MADAQRTVDIVFNGVDKTAAAVQSAIKNTGEFSQNIRGVTQPFANATAAALKYEAALLATGGAITAFAVRAAGDFDGAFREISTLIDEPIGSLGEFRQAILDYATESTGSLENVTSSIYSAISAGVDYTESLEAVRVAEQLSVAGKGELDSTLTLIVSSLNAYGLGMDSAARFSDALFTTVKVGQTTLPELNSSLQAVTGTAATLGVPFEEVLAALAALTATGTPTAQAVTQINAVLAGLLKPSADAAKTATELGIQFDAQAVKANGLHATLQTVAQATGGNEELMAKLFPRVEALRAVFPLTGLAASNFASALEQINDSAGATGAAYEALSSSLENIGNRLAGSFETLLVAFGDPLLNEVGSVANAIREIFTVLTGSLNEGELRDITAFIEQEFASLAETLRGVAEALPQALSEADLSGFTEGLEAVRNSIQSLFGDLDLTDANDLTKALEFVGDSFNGLSQFSAGAIRSFGPLFQLFADLADKANDSADSLGKVGQAFGIATLINSFSSAIGGATGMVQALLGLMIANSGVNLLKGLTGVAAALAGPQGLIALLTALAAFGSFKIFEQLNKAPEAVGWDSLSTNIGDLIDRLSGLAEEAEKLESITILPPQFGDLEIDTDPLVQRLAAAAQAIAGFNEAADPQPLENYVTRLDSIGDVDTADKLNAQMDAFRQTGEIVEETGGKFGDFVGTLLTYPGDIRPSAEALAALGADGQRLGGTFSVISSGADSASRSITSLAGASDELRAKAVVAAIEGAAAIDVARIQADAEQVVAAFDSINNTVTDTGDSLEQLFGLLGDSNISKFDKLGIQKQIRKEDERRERVLKKQERALEAEIRKLNAQADAYRRGDAVIKIDGAGLQPHLEAFMFEILQSIQVRVNQDGENLLLGLQN